MTELEKLNNGEYYSMDDPEIAKIHYRAATLCQQFNALPITESEEREKVLRQLFGSAGKNLSIKPGFFCDLGINLHVGDNFLTNYNVTILDMAPVTIGNNTWIGPGVGIYAVAHPMEAAGRMDRLGIAAWHSQTDNHRRQCMGGRQFHHRDGSNYWQQCHYRCRFSGHARYTRQCSGSWQSGESNPLCRKQK